MTVSMLEKIKEHYAQKVLARFRLEASREEVLGHELVTPCAFVGWLPPAGVLDLGKEPLIPCILLGLDKLDFAPEETDIALRITAIVYDPGHHQTAEAGMGYTPDFQGYKDLLNLLDALAVETRRAGVLAEEFEVAGPISLKMYEEQPYPYWYGCLQFSVRGAAYPTTAFADLM